MKFREKAERFMYQRNGADQFCRFLLWSCIILAFLNLFVRSLVISLLEYALIIYTVFRLLSKNIYKRQKENQGYLRIENKVKSFFGLQRNKWRDRKTHVYRKCPHCRATLRLPKKKGQHGVTCPCCHRHFDLKV